MANQVLERRTFQAGDRIFREGDPGSQAYVVQSGEVEMVKTVEGNEVVIGAVGQGGIFGEMALIDEAPRMALTRAKTGVTLIVISRKLFEEKMAKADPFLRGLLKILAENIRNLSFAASSGAAGPTVATGDEAGDEAS
ncbi:MAG TPA: cyclic nucleotide-binding domain-containing protein [Rhodospirillales bacterium]|jgi:CRP-like cAMP-binding protein|nr:cyclic nucleotide-binding domain-containing protein [Rhodospirillales bacterium]